MFIDFSGNEKVIGCVTIANQLIKDKKFLDDIVSHESFDMSTAVPSTIAFLVKQFSNDKYGQIKVYTYYPAWRWSKAYGYFNPYRPDCIFLNAYKLNRSKGSIVSSLIHEMIHFLDFKSDFSFGHGSNRPQGKQNTVPYWVDNLAEYYVDKQINEGFKSGTLIKTYKPFWSRFWNYLMHKLK